MGQPVELGCAVHGKLGLENSAGESLKRVMLFSLHLCYAVCMLAWASTREHFVCVYIYIYIVIINLGFGVQCFGFGVSHFALGFPNLKPLRRGQWL